MPTCIAGMHRSGTSMVTRLLQACGLFLGPEKALGVDSNNGEPHWENIWFVSLNDKILNRMGGSWNNPPQLPAGWEHTPEFESLRSQARKLIKRIRNHQHWGWKDPRNSLTLPFWRKILPDLRLVICLRNPLEVAHSLHLRGDLIGTPLFQLWLTYYRELLSAAPPEQRVVTHYQSYFQDPNAELQRVAKAIGMELSADVINRACTHVSGDLRHHSLQTNELAAMNESDEVLALYLELCREAGAADQHAIMSKLSREYAT